jgi:hypothetical protein
MEDSRVLVSCKKCGKKLELLNIGFYAFCSICKKFTQASGNQLQHYATQRARKKPQNSA